jgi:hypothetical protein
MSLESAVPEASGRLKDRVRTDGCIETHPEDAYYIEPTLYTHSGVAAATLISICCVPSLGCFARSPIVSDSPVARIQIAPVPPVSANGLSPTIWPGPLSSKIIGSFAMGLMRSNLSVTLSATSPRTCRKANTREFPGQTLNTGNGESRTMA